MSSAIAKPLTVVESAPIRTGRESLDKSKFTLYISSSLLKEVKKLAIDQDMTFSELAEEALSAYLKSAKRL
jgi:hypothetical protein